MNRRDLLENNGQQRRSPHALVGVAVKSGERRKWANHPAAAVGALMLLAACATPSEPKVQIHEVKVPVAVKCAADPGPSPDYPDTPESLKAAPNLYARVQLLLAGRLLRIGREAELLAANSGCR